MKPMKKIVYYYYYSDPFGETSQESLSMFKKWAYEYIKDNFTNYEVEVKETNNVFLNCWTNDEEQHEVIEIFCRDLWDKCPWDWEFL